MAKKFADQEVAQAAFYRAAAAATRRGDRTLRTRAMLDACKTDILIHIASASESQAQEAAGLVGPAP